MKELFQQIDGNKLLLTINTDVYSLEAIFRTCYIFTDRCYLYLSPGSEKEIQVYLKAKNSTVELNKIAGEFCNELINQRVRIDLAHETGKIRELIVAQAFAEGDLLDVGNTGDIDDDPLGIGKLK